MARNADLSPVPQVEKFLTQGSVKMEMFSMMGVFTYLFFELSFLMNSYKSDNFVHKTGASLDSFQITPHTAWIPVQDSPPNFSQLKSRVLFPSCFTEVVP